MILKVLCTKQRNRAQQHCPAIIPSKWEEKKILLAVLSSAVSCHFHVTPLSHSYIFFFQCKDFQPDLIPLSWPGISSIPSPHHVRLLISIAARPESVTSFFPPSFPGILLMVPKLSPRIFPTAFRQFEKQWRALFYNPRCGNCSLTSQKSS